MRAYAKRSAGRGEGCVGRPVRPVGVLASRYRAADLTVAWSCREGRIVVSFALELYLRGKGWARITDRDCICASAVGAGARASGGKSLS